MIKEIKSWGFLPDGREIFLATLENSSGIRVSISNYGCIIQSIFTPDRSGKLSDIVLGYDTLEEYIEGTCYFGATVVGRCANRIANGTFKINGREYRLTQNEGVNTLHGGSGFDTKVWNMEVKDNSLVFSRLSPDGEDGFPGNLKVELTAELCEDNTLKLSYFAQSDKDTVCNLTSHSYFNLSGTKSVEEHDLILNATHYTPVGENLIPTGEIKDVRSTAFDFTSGKKVGEWPLDINYSVDDPHVARIEDSLSGRSVDFYSSLPGIQVYTGCSIKPTGGKCGREYGPYSGMCVEPQYFPDAINRDNFKSPILKAGEEYRQIIEYKFNVK